MSTELRNRPEASRKSWMARWFGSRSSATTRTRGSGPAPPPVPDGAAIGQFVGELIAHDRYAFALLRTAEVHVEDHVAFRAWAAIEEKMALVPPGSVPIVQSDGTEVLSEVSAFYLDRQAVTNRQFARFVAAGCYDDLEIWPRAIWPSVMRFTDRTGQPGPAGWVRGTFPADRADHPVVGVCWYEAQAYARWVGKRLPTAPEWQKAGGWPEQLGGGTCTRYPWGDLFDPARANLWAGGRGGTVPVDDFPGGDTPNGIRQMTGNVWEWLDDPLDTIPCRPGSVFRAWKPMRRIIGGAFDTYLPGEATCHFVTGQEELDRRDNIGFRCALSVDRLRDTL